MQNQESSRARLQKSRNCETFLSLSQTAAATSPSLQLARVRQVSTSCSSACWAEKSLCHLRCITCSDVQLIIAYGFPVQGVGPLLGLIENATDAASVSVRSGN